MKEQSSEPVISLITDFGLSDEYVGVMKGVILSGNSNSRIVDISHDVTSQDVLEAGYLLEASYRYFPRGTVHVAVVDPGVGTNRKILAVETSDYYFLAPDNGLLHTILKRTDIKKIVSVENSKYFLKTSSTTFHGRDIFAPVASYLASGEEIENLGPFLKPDEVCSIEVELPSIHSGKIDGVVSYVDKFGNLITNVSSEVYRDFARKHPGEKVIVLFDGKDLGEVRLNYQSAGDKNPLAVIGSRGYLEIAVNCGSAENYFNARKGYSVSLKATKSY